MYWSRIRWEFDAIEISGVSRNNYSQLIRHEPNSPLKARMPIIDQRIWELQKTKIIFLYIEHNKTLDQVIEQLKAEGLCLS